MTISISEYDTLPAQLEKLGCTLPETDLVLLPANLDMAADIAELKNASTISTVKTLLRSRNIDFGELVGPALKLPQTHNNSFEWISPPILMTAAMILNQSDFTNIVLGIVANYATDFLKGKGSESKVTLDIIIEKKKGKTYKQIKYSGDPKGLEKLPDVIKSIAESE